MVASEHFLSRTVYVSSIGQSAELVIKMCFIEWRHQMSCHLLHRIHPIWQSLAIVNCYMLLLSPWYSVMVLGQTKCLSEFMKRVMMLQISAELKFVSQIESMNQALSQHRWNGSELRTRFSDKSFRSGSAREVATPVGIFIISVGEEVVSV